MGMGMGGYMSSGGGVGNSSHVLGGPGSVSLGGDDHDHDHDHGHGHDSDDDDMDGRGGDYNKSYMSQAGSDVHMDDANGGGSMLHTDVKPSHHNVFASEMSQTTSSSAMSVNADVLLRDQLKWLMGMVRNMKKRKDSVIFLVPVDPVALNIPTYFSIIKSPMDISTIERKLGSKAYKSVGEVFADFDLMFTNCYTFNGVDAPVSMMAKSLQKWYAKELEKLPKTPRTPGDKKKRMSIGGGSVSGDSRPKRDMLPSSRDSLGPSSKKRPGKRSTTELKFCSYVLRELVKKQHSPYNLPFLVPVDPIALGIPHYPTIVKHPMDLSTMRRKLDNGVYDTAAEFEADMRLMFNNCYAFNPPGTDVYNLGKRLESAFDAKWSEKTSFLHQHGEQVAARPAKPKPSPQMTPASQYKPTPFAPSTTSAYNAALAGGGVNQTIVHQPPSSSFAAPVTPAAVHSQQPSYQQQQTSGQSQAAAAAAAKPSRPKQPKPATPAASAATPATSSAAKAGPSQSRPKPAAAEPSSASASKDAAYASSSDDDEEEQHIQMLKTQLQFLVSQIQIMTDKRNKKRKRKGLPPTAFNMPSLFPGSMLGTAQATPAASAPVAAAPVAATPAPASTPAPAASAATPADAAVSTPTPAAKPRAPRARPSAPKTDRKRPPAKKPRTRAEEEADADAVPDEITYEQKRELSENINILPQDKLATVFEIIKENTAFSASGDEEIELDIDSLDKVVLWKLYRFVHKHTRGLPGADGVAAPVAPASPAPSSQATAAPATSAPAPAAAPTPAPASAAQASTLAAPVAAAVAAPPEQQANVAAAPVAAPAAAPVAAKAPAAPSGMAAKAPMSSISGQGTGDKNQDGGDSSSSDGSDSDGSGMSDY
ncbi:hypothetical protein BC831DRAFT_444255, partial [Entophlyctis helioformis]